ncbi:MAG: DUF167 family protein [Hyphomicrobiaceae bacterium]|nr:DUF167 family protein [Hyphomicrobiaceae bacterium]
MTPAPVPWRAGGPGLLVRVRLTPKASRDAVEGIEATADGPALKARVRAVPEDGAANAALERLLAEWLGVPRSTVELVAGGKSRVKTLCVAGDAEKLAARVAARLGEA